MRSTPGVLIVVFVLIAVWAAWAMGAGMADGLVTPHDALTRLHTFDVLIGAVGCTSWEYELSPSLQLNARYAGEWKVPHIVVNQGLLAFEDDVVAFVIGHEATHCAQAEELGRDKYVIAFADHPHSMEIDADIRSVVALCRHGYSYRGVWEFFKQISQQTRMGAGHDMPDMWHFSPGLRLLVMKELVGQTCLEPRTITFPRE